MRPIQVPISQLQSILFWTLSIYALTSCGPAAFNEGEELSSLSSSEELDKKKIRENGSFSVWTVPSDPIPSQTYDLWVAVDYKTLHPSMTLHNDIELSIEGDDEFQIVLKNGRACLNPQVFEARGVDCQPYRKFLTIYRINNDGVGKIKINVPGSSQKITDKITAKSILLRERRLFTVEF